MSVHKTALLGATACAVLASASLQAAEPPKALGPGEGRLDIVAWPGYIERGESDKAYDWVTGFEKETGCKVSVKTAATSDEMVSLMTKGGYDLVTASGDASLRLIFGKTVQPVNTALIPAFDDIMPELKAPGFNTVKDVHYGVSYEWGPNVLMWNTKDITTAPTSWSIIYDKAYAGVITVPDNPIQIADAALYLSHTKPELGITDPYELTQPQMDAVVALLKEQRALVKKYWALASDEVDLFKSGDAHVGAAWPYQANTLRAAGVPVQDTIPTEGATGWADSWMISAHAQHPNCAYLWINHVMTPKVQAQQALSFGETPANTKACAEMDALQPGSCKQYHADASPAYFSSIKFWKTPVRQCGNGQNTCLDYSAWQRAWQQVKQ